MGPAVLDSPRPRRISRCPQAIRAEAMEKREKITLLFWLFLAIFFAVESRRLGIGSFHAPGPGFLPFGASLVVGGLWLVLLLKGRSGAKATPAEPFFPGPGLRHVVFLLGILFLSPYLLAKLGYFLCTFLFILLCMKGLGPLKWKAVLGVGGSATVLFYLLFDTWLQMQLPKGTWSRQIFLWAAMLWK